MTRVYYLPHAKYSVERLPDFEQIGYFIDEFLQSRFFGENLVLRALCSQERPESAIELADIIQQDGTDRGDVNAKNGRGYNKVECDFFGGRYRVDANLQAGERFVRAFYEAPKRHAFPPLRVDVLVAYDASKIEWTPYTKNGQLKTDAFRFVDPERKQDALRAICVLDDVSYNSNL